MLLAAAATTGPIGSIAADSPAPVTFKELYNVIESNLAGTLPTELDQAAVQGLLHELEGKVTLLTGTNLAPTNAAGVLRTNVFDGSYGYLRVGRIDDSTATAFGETLKTVRATSELKGLVVDLRFSEGTNYAAAMQLADQFLKKEVTLLALDETVLKSTEKNNAITLPTVLLVNRKTAGAAEALAAVLRNYNAGLIIGGRTAGQAMLYRDLELSNGQRLRLAARYIRVAEGALLPSKGLKPDIEVEVKDSDERKYFEDPYAGFAAKEESATPGGGLFGRSINEAELVRRHREGQNPDAETTPEKPVVKSTEKQVRDPALSRALDLLKGLAVIKKLD